MADFIDRAYLRSLAETDSIAKAAFADLFSAIAELQAVHSKAYLDTENIESLFGAIEMSRLLGKLGSRGEADIARLHESIITAIVRTLEFSIKFKVSGGRIMAAEPYGDFAKMLKTMAGERQLGHSTDYGIISFNYDLTVEQALMTAGMAYHYGLPSDSSATGIPVLKLHGSINWGTCATCKQVVPYHPHQAHFDHLRDSEYVFYNLGSTLHRQQHCGADLQHKPLVVPPTWNKGEYHGQIGAVWRRAATLLGSAQNVFVIGYSLPESDAFFRYLYALGSESTSRLRRFWVFNPDSSGVVESRFRSLTGRGIDRAFRYIPGALGTFAEAIPEIARGIAEQA
jgi:hypothetical protein